MHEDQPGSNVTNDYHPVGQVVTPGDQPQISGAGIDQPPTPPPVKKSRKGLVALLLVIALLIIGGAAFGLTRSSSRETASSANFKKDIPNLRYVSINSGWDKFYPDIDSSVNYQESNSMLFEGLVRFKNKSNTVPLLADSWTNPNASTWVFKLKSGVTFHTGKEMTAEDVKASFEDAKSSEYGETYGSTIQSVTADSKYQVTIKTDGPDPTLLNKLAAYYVYDTTSGKPNDPVNGTGPMVVKPGTVPSADALELVAFDQYHGGRIHVRSLSFVGTDDTASGQAFENGQANLMQFSSDGPSAVTTRKYGQEKFASLGNYIMPLNSMRANSPLAQQKVREAVQLAIDPAAIAKARNTSYTPANQLVPKIIPGYNANIAEFNRNVVKAKQLLAEAGYPNGFSMELTYFTPQQAAVDTITKSLAEAGITVKPSEQTDTSVLGEIAFGGKTDAFLSTFASDIFDASDVLSRFADSANYKNQAVLDDIADAQSTLDSNRHLAALKSALAKVSANNGVIFIYTPVNADSIIFDSSFVVPREFENNALGVYIQDVYAK